MVSIFEFLSKQRYFLVFFDAYSTFKSLSINDYDLFSNPYNNIFIKGERSILILWASVLVIINISNSLNPTLG